MSRGIRHIQEPAKHERIQLTGIVPNGQTQHHTDPIKTGEYHGGTGLCGGPPGDNVSAAAATAATTAAPGTIPSIPPKARPTTIPGNTECTKASTLNSMARKLTSTPTLPPTIPRINSSTRGRCRYGRVRILNEHDATELHWCRRWRHDHRQKPRSARIFVRQDCSRGWTPPPRFPAA